MVFSCLVVHILGCACKTVCVGNIWDSLKMAYSSLLWASIVPSAETISAIRYFCKTFKLRKWKKMCTFQSISCDVRLFVCVCVVCATFCVCVLFFFTSYYYHLQRLNLLQKYVLGKTFKRIDWAILAQKWSIIATRIFFFFVGLRNSLWMDLGHNQQQHPTVHNGGNSRGRVSGCTRREIECLPYAGFFGYIQCSVADIDWSEFVLIACTVKVW